MDTVTNVEETATVDLAAMLEAGGGGGLVELVSGQTRLVVHRAVLAARSPVFAAMFRHDTLEARSSEVTITDTGGPELSLLVAYLYTLRAPQLPGLAPQLPGLAPQLPSLASQLLAAADKYGVLGLKAACEQQLIAQLDVENAAAAAVVAARHSCTSLALATIAFIKAHPQVFSTQGWADAELEQPQDVAEVRRLLREPPTETRSLSQEEKDTRLIQAAKRGAVEELWALLAAGANVAAKDEERNTALHWAAEKGHLEAARCLLKTGAPLDARCSNNEDMPLHWAAGNGHAAVVRLLVAASADPNGRSSTGWSPLHCAAWRNHVEAVTVLLEAGADRGALTIGGLTPLDIAEQHGHQQAIDVLTRSPTNVSRVK
ncbi:ankyrin-1-like [Schistocerca serialis cubense]|uniref:ankyrin-1-like n=1 Tax=Schistocerca serialis cubense TaxID=2023355 RepID=UPI00214E156F|nr:ankyrin-1-like [Schistocerca serialis cubense]